MVSKPERERRLSRFPSIVNCLANSSQTNCFVTFAVNSIERGCHGLNIAYVKQLCILGVHTSVKSHNKREIRPKRL